jgi:hypothetical protein
MLMKRMKIADKLMVNNSFARQSHYLNDFHKIYYIASKRKRNIGNEIRKKEG